MMDTALARTLGKSALNFLPWTCLLAGNVAPYVESRGSLLNSYNLSTPQGSSGGPIVTEDGIGGMVLHDGGALQVSDVMPIDVIARNIKSWACIGTSAKIRR